MNCKKAEQLLVGYLYQELSAKQVVEIEKHLELCDNCAKTLESWRAIHQGYKKSPEEEPQAPGYMKQKLLIAAKEEITRRASFLERFSLLIKPALILPILVFVLLTILYLPWQPLKESNQARFASPQQARLSREEKQISPTPKTQTYDRIATNATAPKRKADAPKEISKDVAMQNKEEAMDEKRSMGSSSLAQDSGGAPPAAASPAPLPEEPAPIAQQEQSAAAGYLKNQPVATAKKIADQESDKNYYNEAQSLFRQDDLKGGVRLAQQAIERDNARTLAVQFHQTGIQYQQSRECGKAIPQFLLIVNNYREYPDLQNVLMRLADCYEEIGQIDAARKIYARLLAYPAVRDVATQKIQQLDKKIQSQEELKALGYTNDQN